MRTGGWHTGLQCAGTHGLWPEGRAAGGLSEGEIDELGLGDTWATSQPSECPPVRCPL